MTHVETNQRRSPGFAAVFFLVLLRLAIGWHFFYEGAWKIQSGAGGDEPSFSSAGYLKNATGPLGPYFRKLAGDLDPDGRDALDHAKLSKAWKTELDRVTEKFGFDAEQGKRAAEALTQTESKAEAWFEDSDNKRKIAEYFHKLDNYRVDSAAAKGFTRKSDWMKSAWSEIQSTKGELLGYVDGLSRSLRDQWNAIATPEQIEKAGSYAPDKGMIPLIDKLTMYGLAAIGIGLIFGFLTRLSAFSAAAFLTLVYLSSPPWPGLPQSPMSEGHYLYVNKNLIELIACLAIMSLPTGRWFGVDAILGAKSRPAAVEEESR